MPQHVRSLAILVAAALVSDPSFARDSKAANSRPAPAAAGRSGSPVIWREPADIAARNLYYGPGGEEHQPHGPYTFAEEDTNGTTPKLVVRDRDNVKWTVKLGIEARPETVASRLVWAVGYFANEDYFLADMQVGGMPPRLKRGQEFVGPGGTLHAARLKRHLGEEKEIETWKWRDDPFTGTRELNGLKVMMALINNWDLKDANNKLYADKSTGERLFVVSDLGASFGTTGLSVPFSRSKGNLKSYMHSKFIARVSGDYVDFRTPSHPSLIYALWPPPFLSRLRVDGVIGHIPREDARWIGNLLACLTPEQIRDAFRAAGYTGEQVAAFSKVVENRIAALNDL